MPHWAKVPKPLKKPRGAAKCHYIMGSKIKNPPPMLGKGIYFDSNVSILSRVYDRDRERIVDRGNNLGVCGMLCWHSDFEKTEELHNFCVLKSPVCFFMLGIFPDNISRSNKTLQDAWILKVDEYSREANCLAIYSGINYSRDPQTYFAQESMLRCLYQQAKTLSIPLVLFIDSNDVQETQTVDKQLNNLTRVTEILLEEGWIPLPLPATTGRNEKERVENIPVIIQDTVGTCRSDPSLVSYLVGAGYHLSVSINEHFALPQNDISALSTDDSSTTVANTPLSQCLRLIPQSRLLLSSCSPLHTPQNIPDAHMRDSKNEPSNFEFIVSAVAPYIDLQPEALAMLNLTNSMAVYHLKSEDSNSVCASANLSAGISASTDSTGGNSGEIHSNASVSEVPLSGLTLAGIHLDDNSSYSTISSATVGATGSNSQSQQQLMCSKCHHILFSQTHLIHQHVSGSNTVLLEAPSATESTTVEHCTAVYFLPVTLLGCCSGSYVDSLSVDSSSNVSCSHCSTKLGKQIVTRNDDSGVGVVSSCPCGYEIRQDNAEFSSFEGGLLRLTSTKIKPVVHSSSTCTNSDTSSRAAVERELQPYRKDRSKSTANESEDDLPHVALSGKAGKRGKQGKKK